MSQKQKLGIAAGAICLLLCTFGAFTYAEPQPLLADCTTELNEQPTNHNSAYTDQIVIEPPITIDLEHDFEEEEWVENTLTVTNPRDVAVIIKIALNCETEKYCTVKAFFPYSWGQPWVKVTHSCIQKGTDFPASDYCDELEYDGYTDVKEEQKISAFAALEGDMCSFFPPNRYSLCYICSAGNEKNKKPRKQKEDL